MKKCFKCGKEKGFSEFYRHKQMADGHLNKCKDCAKKDVSANYLDNIDHYKEYEKSRATKKHRVEARREYAQTDDGRAAARKARLKWEKENPIKRAASLMVGNAIKAGKLEKPEKCEQCPSTKKLHGHHDDYSKPLSVRWLCPRCHTGWHRNNGEGANGD